MWCVVMLCLSLMSSLLMPSERAIDIFHVSEPKQDLVVSGETDEERSKRYELCMHQIIDSLSLPDILTSSQLVETGKSIQAWEDYIMHELPEKYPDQDISRVQELLMFCRMKLGFRALYYMPVRR